MSVASRTPSRIGTMTSPRNSYDVPCQWSDLRSTMPDSIAAANSRRLSSIEGGSVIADDYPGAAISLRVQFSPGVQVVPVEQRVEHEEVAPDRRTAVHRVVREQHDVSLLERRVEHDRALGDVGAVEQSGDEELALIGKAQDRARTLIGRNDVERVAQHF